MWIKAAPARAPLAVTLRWMVEGEDPLTFIETFQATAVSCHWLKEEWVPRLLPLLSGDAQTPALSWPPASQGPYSRRITGGVSASAGWWEGTVPPLGPHNWRTPR